MRAVLRQSAGLCGCLPPGTLSPPSFWSTYQFKARLRSTGSSSTISYISVPGQPMDWLPVDQGPTPWPISYGQGVRSCDTSKASKCFPGAKNLTGTGIGHTLEQCFSKCGPWTSSSSSTWNLLEMPILGPHPRLLNEGPQGRGPAVCMSPDAPGDSHAHSSLRTTALD